LEAGRRVVRSGAEVALDRSPRMLGDHRSAFDIAVAAHDDAVAIPVRAIQLQRLGDPAAGG
jgi:hypothetical protein